MTAFALVEQPSPIAPPEGDAARLSAYATGLTALTAVIALVIAWKAFTATRATPFTQLVVNELFSIMRRARETRSHYVHLFKPFESEAAKEAAWGAWTRAREEVGVSLDEMALLVADVKDARGAWKKVEDEEDSHVTSKNTTISDDAARAATKRYDETHNAFVSKMTEIMKKLR